MPVVSRGGRQVGGDPFAQQTQIAAQTAQQRQQREAVRGQQMLDFLTKQADDAGYSVSQFANLNPELFKDAFKALKGGLDFGGQAEQMLQATQRGPVTAEQFKAFEEDQFTKEQLRGLMSGDIQEVEGQMQIVSQQGDGPTPQTVTVGEEKIKGSFENLTDPSNWAPVFNAVGFEQTDPEKGIWEGAAQDFRQGIIDQVFPDEGKTWGTLSQAERGKLLGAVKAGNVSTTVERDLEAPGSPKHQETVQRVSQFVESVGTPAEKASYGRFLNSVDPFSDVNREDVEGIKSYLEFKIGMNQDLSREEADKLAGELSNKLGFPVKELPPVTLDIFKNQKTLDTVETPLEIGGVELPADDPVAQNIGAMPKAQQGQGMNIFEAKRQLQSVYPESISQADLQMKRDMASMKAVDAQARYQESLINKLQWEMGQASKGVGAGNPMLAIAEQSNSAFVDNYYKGNLDAEQLKAQQRAAESQKEQYRKQGIQFYEYPMTDINNNFSFWSKEPVSIVYPLTFGGFSANQGVQQPSTQGGPTADQVGAQLGL